MPGIIIADTSCLILLTKLGLLEILKELYEEVVITNFIAEEYKLEIPTWIKIVELSFSEVEQFSTKVDLGEASAIALALNAADHLVLLDDIQARRLAATLKIQFTGTLGVLIQAKQKGIVSEIKPIIQEIKLTNFYLSDQLENQVLFLADEL